MHSSGDKKNLYPKLDLWFKTSKNLSSKNDLNSCVRLLIKELIAFEDF